MTDRLLLRHGGFRERHAQLVRVEQRIVSESVHSLLVTSLHDLARHLAANDDFTSAVSSIGRASDS